MYELVVVGFKKDMFRASTVLNKLIDMEYDWTVDLHHGVAVYRDYSGRLRVDQSYGMAYGTDAEDEGAAWGLLWGSLIGGLLAVPFTAGASATIAAGTIAAGAVGGGALGAAGGVLDADWWRDELGISDAWVADATQMIEPGDSAILVVVHSYDPEFVAAQLRGYGGTVLRTTLSEPQADKLQAVLDGRR